MKNTREPYLLNIEDLPQSTAEILDASAWTNHFSWEQVQMICRHLKPYAAPEGCIIFEEGDPGVDMGIIIKGAIAIYKNGKQISLLKKGRTFGEMSLLDNQPRSASAIAVGNTIYLLLDKDGLAAIAKNNPTLAFKIVWNIAQQISMRLRQANGQLSEFLD